MWVGIVPPSTAQSSDWMTWASTYTHDCNGMRVDQYAQPVQPVGPSRSDFVRSGFRNFRSTLQAGQSADNYHVTEQWGQPVMPYEHWRFPFRPFGVPYDAWGPPTPYGMFFGAGLGFPPWLGHPGQGIGFPHNGFPQTGNPHMRGPHSGGHAMQGPGNFPHGMPGPGWGSHGGQFPQYGQPAFGFPLQPNYMNQPWFDGTYPDAPPLDNRSDQEFFWKPLRPPYRAFPPANQP